MERAQYDVAIIGAGVFGLCIAWFCARRGMRVCLYEAQRIGQGASSGLIGALSPHMPEKWNDKKAFQFEALTGAQAFWDEIAQRSGSDPFYRRNGRLLPLRSDAARDLANARSQEAKELWQGAADWSVVAEATGVAPASHGFVYETLSAQLFPKAAINALAQACRAVGVEIHENQPRDPSACNAETVVIAAGHDSGALLPVALAPLSQGVKGQSALLDIELADQPIIFDNGVYVVAQGHHGTAVGSTSEKSWDHTGVDTLLDPLVARAATLVPALKDAPIKESWAGIRPRARLPDPVIGEVAPRILLATGGFKIGLGLGPEIGKRVAGMIAGEDPALPTSFTLAHQAALIG